MDLAVTRSVGFERAVPIRVQFDSISRFNRVGGSICFSLCSLTGAACVGSMFNDTS